MRLHPALPRAALVICLGAVALEPGSVTASPTGRVARIDPYLARAAALAALPRTPSTAEQARAGLTRLDRIVSLDLSAEPPAAMVRVAGRPTDRALAGIGARRVSQGRATALVRVRLRDLPALAALPGVLAVESVGRIERRLDVAGPLVGATALHAADPAITGAGVVYGSIDDGIDIRHPTFQNPDGTTRVEAFWDVCDESGRPPEGFEEFGGSLYTREDIDAALEGDEDRFPHVDAGGHGTMTAAIGAGSGDGGELVGMAPGAAIVVVAIFGDAQGSCANQNIGLLGSIDSLLTEASRFIETTAADRPFVINMSLGDHLGPHDGTSLLDTELEAIATAAPGRALVAAAGNEGRGGLHAGVLLPADGTIYGLEFAGSYDEGAAMELWFPRDAQIEMRLRQGAACMPFVPVGEESLGDVYYVDNAHLGVDARNGDNVAFVEAWGDFGAAGGDAEGCTAACAAFSERCDGDPFGAEGACLEDCQESWSAERVQCVTDFVPRRGRGCNATFRACMAVRATLELRATGGRDARVDVYATGTATAVDGEDAAMTIGGPASSRGVIAVGALVHRAQAGQLPAQGAVGDLTDYSSQGPMRDGRTKPEIAAPAELITSALATGNEPFGVVVSDDGLWMTTSGGTSAASPGVAGAVALLLEAHPELDLPAIHQALAQGAVTDAHTGAVPNDAWGWGKLQVEDALATLEDVRDDGDGDGFDPVFAGGLDCDDDAAEIHPRARELGDNGLDDDCDGHIDEPLPDVGFVPRTEPVCTDELPPDAGVDAGEPITDGGDLPPLDAGAGDGGTATPDAGADGSGGVAGGGCTCGVTQRPERRGHAAWLLGAALALAALRRRAR